MCLLTLHPSFENYTTPKNNGSYQNFSEIRHTRRGLSFKKNVTETSIELTDQDSRTADASITAALKTLDLNL